LIDGAEAIAAAVVGSGTIDHSVIRRIR